MASKTRLNLQSSSEAKAAVKFPIVGIGASAGGLEPITKLLENLPVQTGLSFVVIQHLAAGQESMLPEILSRFTKMKVQQAKDNMQIEQDHVYVIPPGTTMTLRNECIKLLPKGSLFKPINDFLVSLASELKAQAIGIVLSGTGNDGTEGLKAVKAEGGITFAQDPDTAQYPDMPKNAIAAGTPDFVLSPEQIARELSRIAKFPQIISLESKVPKQAKVETELKKVLAVLKGSFGVDFTHYRETTINRRVTRRMVINKTDNMKAYLGYLRAHPSEQQALFDDMLIGVTKFFREPETFSALKEKVFPVLAKDRSHDESMRVWVPGCSTGEDVYSLAMIIQEFLGEKNLTEIRVQIFGTDANEKNIEKARQGTYSKNIEDAVSGNRLKQFFASENGHYRITKPIRDMCIFAKQDITTDPPFSNIDLIMCRNVLIYFDEYLHQRILPIFHYGLKPNGFLVLGESESIGKFQNLFEPIIPKGLIYRKKQAVQRTMFGEGAFTPYAANKTDKPLEKKDMLTVLGSQVDRLIMTEYGPATLLVNSGLDILVFRGDVAPYLSPESGVASLNVTKIIRKELRSQVQTAVYRARKEDRVLKETVQYKQKGQSKTVNIEVRPLRTAEYNEPFYLVLFTDAAPRNPLEAFESAVLPSEVESLKDRRVRELREDLEAAKESLQTLVEGQEATNEELRSSMEEVQSSNEELMSTNEELETAKEELQSGNEELQTLNEELKNRNQALGRLNDDLANLQTNIDIPVVIVDNDLKIRRFTASAQTLLKISSSDVGHSIANMKGVIVADLEKTITDVISELSVVDREVAYEDRWYEMHVRAYLTEDKKINGAVLSFMNITDRKKAEEAIKKQAALINLSPDAVIVKKIDETITFWSAGAEKLYGYKKHEAVGQKINILLKAKHSQSSDEVISQLKRGRNWIGEITHYTKNNDEVLVQSYWSAALDVRGNIVELLESNVDITERKRAELALRESEQRYHTLFSNMEEAFFLGEPVLDSKGNPVDFRILEANVAFEKQTGLKLVALLGKTIKEALPGLEESWVQTYCKVALTGEPLHFEDYNSNTRRYYEVYSFSPIKGRFASLFTDITERKKMEQELSNSLKESRQSECEISALLKASRAVLEKKEFQNSALAIFNACKELIGATAGYVALLSKDGKGNELLFLDSGGLPCTVDPSLPMPIRGLRAEAYRSGKVAVENDFPQSEWQKFAPEGHVLLENVLFAPLTIKQRTVGVIGLANKPGGFGKRDAEMAKAFGELASVALANSQMLEALEEDEKALKAYSGHLEELVEERTQKLRDSERLAAIGVTASMVGHDVRNPLQAIISDVYLAKTELALTPESDEKKCALESLMEIEKNIDYINKIVADLQDFARPLKPNLDTVDLKFIIDALLAKKSLPENVKASVAVEVEAMKVVADSTFISRIMHNLVNNAVQAMPKGGELSISAFKDKKTGEAVITVADTGLGIPDSVRGKLFTPMFTTKAKGQGFGLVVIKRMTEALGGTVSFESQEGKGTTFKVRLPPQSDKR